MASQGLKLKMDCSEDSTPLAAPRSSPAALDCERFEGLLKRRSNRDDPSAQQKALAAGTPWIVPRPSSSIFKRQGGVCPLTHLLQEFLGVRVQVAVGRGRRRALGRARGLAVLARARRDAEAGLGALAGALVCRGRGEGEAFQGGGRGGRGTPEKVR